MYRIEFTRQYLRDLRNARKRNLDEGKLNEVVRMLSEGKQLPQKLKNHPLVGPGSHGTLLVPRYGHQPEGVQPCHLA